MFWLFFISVFLVIIIIVYGTIPWAEGKVLFYPSRKSNWKPDTRHKNRYISVKDYRPINKSHARKEDCIHGWHFNNFPGHNTVLFCHGNSGNISYRKYIINICEKFKLNLFIYDYRGFGKSSGNPSKRNLRKDGETAYKYLTNYCGIKPKNIIVWGESLGGIPAIYIASKYKCKCLILLSTLSGLDDATIYSFKDGMRRSIAYGMTSLASIRFDMIPTKEYMKRVKCPVVIMHSTEDDVIPYRCAEILYHNVPHNKKTLIPIQGKHSAPDISRKALEKVLSYCDISLSEYETHEDCNVSEILEDIRTVAERYHNFID
jgi:pimeloyl-ACP methyl ester carboxylesterase